eukprot:gnl/TRDRNA2_/TRDRNA2_89732_c0_seq1.p1 gnl/TRDRNA2_/TRDRNA2_89732_c0~~gnl/TRDRNA2_/TRDRNA2_89732_c0_seq1.p1  ORF type:complete len:264 (-),score=47.58 gnl/TRDRNA2_/TRDRNA2_89732_c0_seq1:182-973(-)
MLDWDDAPTFGAPQDSLASLEDDALAALAQAGAAPRGPLDELLGDLIEGSSWLTHVVALDAGDGLVCLAAPELPTCVVVPGSFNPLHRGHEEMARKCANLVGRKQSTALFEICVANADKGAIDLSEMSQRVENIVSKGYRVLVTCATLFAQKAVLCAGSDFAVGYDTYARIVNPKYYVPTGKSLEDADAAQQREWVVDALRSLSANRIRIAVAGRIDASGEYRSLEKDPLLELPDDLAGLFLVMPDFRLDVSSTDIRQRQLKK